MNARRLLALLLFAIATRAQEVRPLTILHSNDLHAHLLPDRRGFDVSTLGNHEFDYGWQRIQDFVKTARFPIVSANVVNDQGGLLAGKPYVIKTAGGIRVAVIGLLLGDLD